MTEGRGRVSEFRPRRFRRYPDYRDSGVEWLGEVPAHWDIAPVYARYKVALGKMLDAKRVTGESSGKYLRNVDVQWDAVNTEDLPEMDFPPSERNRYLLCPEDLLVCEGGEVGRTAMWGGKLDECFYQKAIHRVRRRSDSELPRFFYFLMYTLAKRGVFAAGGNPNTIGHLTAIQLRHYRVPFPAKNEQRTIATFLDRETAKIDALVAKKERLIELLQEKRTALITRAVTRGLDPNVPMKDSGIEWLGEIPAHWGAKKIKRLCLVRRGASPRPIDDPAYFDDNGMYAWVRIADVTASKRYLETTPQRLSVLGQSKSVSLEPGELFLSIAATVGKPIVTKIKCCIHDGFVYFVGLHGNREYLYYVFTCGEAYKGLGKLGTQLNLNTDTIGDICVPVPPPEEQQAVVQFLDRETYRTDVLIAKVHEAIDHLTEYRTALISAAVTGKIDVRDEAA